MHYVSVFIETEFRRLYTCDSLPHESNYQTDMIILIRKWITKSMSLIDHYIENNETRLDLTFTSDDMAAGIEFNDEIEINSIFMVKLILCIIMTMSPK